MSRVKAVGKVELAQWITDVYGGTSRDARDEIEHVLESIRSFLLDGERVTIKGFGSFYAEDRAERKGRNPQTGEEITIPAKRVPKCKLRFDV